MSTLIVATWAAGLLLGTTEAVAGPGPDFAGDVWPVLEEHCTSCHGTGQTYSNLRLDSVSAIRRGGDLGAVLVAGDAEASEIYRRPSLPPDDLDFMPVDAEPLSQEELEVLAKWIDTGADFGAWTSAEESER